MHTRLRTLRHSPFEIPLDGTLSRVVGLILFGGVLVLSASPTAAQVGFPGAPDEAGINLRVYPLDTWSPRVGVGVGAGLVLHHLGRTNAQGLLTFAPARHEQVATAAWASANPHRARQYVLANGRGLHTNRDWFYGLGPGSRLDARQSIERSAVQVRIRAGQAFFDHRLTVQPHVGFSAHRVDRVPDPTATTLSRASQRHLQQLANEDLGPLDAEQTGLRVGIEATYDTRPQRSRPARGVLLYGGWSRYIDLSSSFVRFDKVDLGAHGFLPLDGAHRLAGRLLLTLTENRGRAAVPYYHRPTLGGSLVPGWRRQRFVASDRLVGSILYRFPLVHMWGVVDIEGHLGVHAASVYDDFPSDAALDLTTFDESLDPELASVPLRPSVSAGIHVGLPFREMPSLDLALGLSPEGVTAVRFTFRQDLQALRPPHHQSIRRY